MGSFALLALLPALAVANPTPTVKSSREGVIAEGKTVILGTWLWTIEGNQLGSRPEADFWWEQVNAKERYLVPRPGVGCVLLKGAPYDRVTREDLAGATFSAGKVSGDQLRPNAVLAVRTRGGKLAKAKVVGYRALHDFSFPEAELLTPRWRAFVLQKPNSPEYHLEVLWTLYRAK